MKSVFLLLLLVTVGFFSSAQNKKALTKNSVAAAAKPAQGIRKYYFVMLLKGSRRDQDSLTAAKIQEGHMANITRLYNEGKLKVAGPFGDDGNWLGIFIFDCVTEEEVASLLKTDPAVSSGRLAYEIRPWYTQPSGSFLPGKPKPAF